MEYKKYKITKEVWSLNGKYTITDEHNNLVVIARKKGFSFKSEMTVFNDIEEELYSVRKKIFSFKPIFFISKDGQDEYKLFKTINSFKPEIFIESLSRSETYCVKGNIWGSEYKIYDELNEIAFVSKDFWKMNSSYGIAIREDANVPLFLTTVLIIDLIKIAQSQT